MTGPNPSPESADGPRPESFRTAADQGRAGFEVKGSMFVGRVAPFEHVDAAETFIEAVCAANADATHNVPAYWVRAGEVSHPRLREWSSDAGEPTGSAGTATLNVLIRRDLVNVATDVTRQFGGTELGTGGLARDYGRAVSMAVDDAGVAVREPHRRVAVEVDYDDSETVRSLLETAGVEFEADYGVTARFAVRVPVADTEEGLDRLRSATGGHATIERGD